MLRVKMFLVFGAGTFYVLGAVGNAQDVALPSPEPRAATPTPQPAVTPPPPIIPPGVLALPEKNSPARPQVPDIPALDEGFKPAPVSPEAEKLRKHIEWRRLRNEVQNDRDLKATLEAATSAATDLEKRKMLGHYYDLFYGKMIARAAPEMKSYLLDRKREAVGTLPQPRVRPGVVMSQTSGVLPTPSPTPSPTRLFSQPGIETPDR